MKKLIYTTIGVLLSIFISAVAFTWWKMSSIPLCEELLIMEKSSLLGDYVATVFERNCGATTNYVTHINIRSSGTNFISDADNVITEGQLCSITGKHDVSLSWRDSYKLQVFVENQLSELKCIKVLGEIEIQSGNRP